MSSTMNDRASFIDWLIVWFVGCIASYGWILEWEQMAQEEDWLVEVKMAY